MTKLKKKIKKIKKGKKIIVNIMINSLTHTRTSLLLLNFFNFFYLYFIFHFFQFFQFLVFKKLKTAYFFIFLKKSAKQLIYFKKYHSNFLNKSTFSKKKIFKFFNGLKKKKFNLFSTSKVNQLFVRRKKKNLRYFKIFLRKNIKLITKKTINTMRKKYYMKYINLTYLRHYLNSFKNKSLFEINNIFKGSLYNVINSNFPFFNKYYVHFLIKKKIILLNFKIILSEKTFLKNGDFILFNLNHALINTFTYWLQKQKRYLWILKKKFFLLRKAHNSNIKKDYSQHFSRYFFFTKRFFLKFKNNIEFDYFTFSFFFFFNCGGLKPVVTFNPFLFRLLQLK